MRSEDKSAFIKCKSACKVNYGKARLGKWTYPEAEGGAEEKIDPKQLAESEEKKAATLPENNAEIQAMKAQIESMKQEQGGGNKTMTWVIIVVIVFALVGVSIYLINRKKSA